GAYSTRLQNDCWFRRRRRRIASRPAVPAAVVVLVVTGAQTQCEARRLRGFLHVGDYLPSARARYLFAGAKTWATTPGVLPGARSTNGRQRRKAGHSRCRARTSAELRSGLAARPDHASSDRNACRSTDCRHDLPPKSTPARSVPGVRAGRGPRGVFADRQI